MSYTPPPNYSEGSYSENPYTSPPPGVGDGYPLNNDDRLWGMLAHLSALSGYVIPFGNVIGPLIIWVLKKDQMPFVDDQGKESLNFQINVLLLAAIVIASLCTFIGIVLAPILAVYALVMTVIAAVKANQGIAYRYPFILRLIR